MVNVVTRLKIEAHLEPWETSVIELLCKNSKGLKVVNYF